MAKTLCILGSTGSIGTQCLDIVQSTEYSVYALAASENIDLLEQQIRKYTPQMAAMLNREKAKELSIRVADTNTKVYAGEEGVLALAGAGCDMVLNAIVGIAGLLPTLTAIKAGSVKALNLNLNLHTNLLKVWTIFVVEVCTSFPLDQKWV